jgi:hypothetical protein
LSSNSSFQGGKSELSRRYELVLLPGTEFAEVFISLVKVGEDGVPKTLIWNGRPLGYGYYPADRPLIVDLQNLEDAGIYKIEIGARIRGGGTYSFDMWIYCPDSR